MIVVEWLLDSNPSIGWLVMQDLIDEPDDVVAAERSKVASEGWVALQGEVGQWGGGTNFSKWTSTTNTLSLLRNLGLDPASDEAPERRRSGQ